MHLSKEIPIDVLDTLTTNVSISVIGWTIVWVVTNKNPFQMTREAFKALKGRPRLAFIFVFVMSVSIMNTMEQRFEKVLDWCVLRPLSL